MSQKDVNFVNAAVIGFVKLSREKVTKDQPRAFYKYSREIKSISPERSWSMRDAYSPRPRSFAFFPSLVCRSHAAAAYSVSQWESSLTTRRWRKATVIPGLSMCGQTRYSSALRGWVTGRYPRALHEMSWCRFQVEAQGQSFTRFYGILYFDQQIYLYIYIYICYIFVILICYINLLYLIIHNHLIPLTESLPWIFLRQLYNVKNWIPYLTKCLLYCRQLLRTRTSWMNYVYV